MAAIPGWMAVCAAAGAVGGAAYRAISPSKRQRGPSEGESAPPPHSVPDECDDGEEEVAGGENSADGRGRKGGKRGKVSDRWVTRCTKEAITGDLATGCGCPSGCTDHMSVDLVMTERKEVAKLDGDERRTDLRTYLDGNVNTSTTIGFNLHPLSDSDRRLCANAFDIMRGYGYGYTYKFIRAARDGIGQDGLGAEGAQDRYEEDSLESIVSNGSIQLPTHRPRMQGPASSLHAGTK
jgi:hypothetical protein